MAPPGARDERAMAVSPAGGQAAPRGPAWHHWGVAQNPHLERYPGKYVALDRATYEVILVADTARELHELIQERGLRNVAWMRAPREDEPLFIGPA